jgi:ribulose-phosphate 3-epimerase
MKVKIAPSILSADFSQMGKAIEQMNEIGADLIHCDVMDGTFVAPITFGGQMVKNIKKLTNIPLDVHLMVEHPQTQVRFFAEAGADIITVHYEACRKISDEYLVNTLDLIKNYGVKCGVVINPDTDVEKIFDVFPMCDMIVIMSVFPGYGGQKFIETSLEQIKKARIQAIKTGRPHMDIEVDGGITPENVRAVKDAGANVVVAGSAIFKAEDMHKAIEELRIN